VTDHSIRGFIFDFGGVLASEEARNRRFLAYDRQLGLPPETVRYTLFSGPAWEAVSTGRMTPLTYWRAINADRWARRLPPDFVALRDDNFHDQPLDAEMVRMVIALSRQFPVALCSNALPSVLCHLQEDWALYTAFDAIIISALVGLRKPDPAIYELTAARLSVPPAHCLLVDDKARNTEVARAIGMPAFRFTTAGEMAQMLRREGIWPVDLL